MTDSTFREYIGQISSLSEEGLSLLEGHFAQKELKKGETLLKQGSVCRAYYFVEKGYLRTFFNKEGVEINLYFNFEGSFISDLKSLKSNLASELSIVAGEPVVMRIFDRKVLDDMCNRYPEIMLFSRRLLSKVVMTMAEHNNLFKIFTPAERYEYIQKHSPEMLQRVSLSHLASYLGVNRKTLSRIRGKK
jgi:CRP-like cAMP-binding protein